MGSKVARGLTRIILNREAVREAFRDAIPQIDQIERLEGLQDVKLTYVSTTDETLQLGYEGVATPDLYANMRATIVGQDIVPEADVTDVRLYRATRPDEYRTVTLILGEHKTELELRAYNPEYQGSRKASTSSN